jgi:hypothetical protein
MINYNDGGLRVCQRHYRKPFYEIVFFVYILYIITDNYLPFFFLLFGANIQAAWMPPAAIN